MSPHENNNNKNVVVIGTAPQIDLPPTVTEPLNRSSNSGSNISVQQHG